MKKQDNWIIRIMLAILISMLTVSVSVAEASPLTRPKADGLIGEQLNGYIGLVRYDVPAEIKKLVDEANAKRQAGYQRIAERQGVSLSEVEKVGAIKAFEKTLIGDYIRDTNGIWHIKSEQDSIQADIN